MFFGKSKDVAKGCSPSQSSSPAAASAAMGWLRGTGQQFNDSIGRNKSSGPNQTSNDVLLEDLHVVKENHRLHPHSFKWSAKHLTGDDPKR